MLRIDLAKARPGMTLALPVPNPNMSGRMLLKEGYALTDGAIRRVGEMGVRTLWVSYPGLAAVEKYIDLQSMVLEQNVVEKVAGAFEAMQRQAAARLDYEQYTDSVRAMVAHIATDRKTAVFVGELVETADDQLRHASTVSYLSLLMGLKLEAYMVRERKHVNPARAKEVINLGAGAMLHDLGLTQIDPDALRRYRESGDDSDEAFRKHTALGYQAVRGQITPSSAIVLLHHHQRFDGSGYAGGGFDLQRGAAIHIYPRIVAVADAFDRIRRPVNLPEQPGVFALHPMLGDAMARRFDPVVLRALLEVAPPYPPGALLKFSDGRAAVAIDHNIHAPCRPLVRILSDEAHEDEQEPGEQAVTIDLAQQPAGLCVVQCNGRNTAEYNFGPSLLKAVA